MISVVCNKSGWINNMEAVQRLAAPVSKFMANEGKIIQRESRFSFDSEQRIRGQRAVVVVVVPTWPAALLQKVSILNSFP